MSQRKVALLDVAHYGRERFSAYYEIGVDNVSNGVWWRVRIYDYGTAAVLEEFSGTEGVREEADVAAQTTVLNAMEKYRRGARV